MVVRSPMAGWPTSRWPASRLAAAGRAAAPRAAQFNAFEVSRRAASGRLARPVFSVGTWLRRMGTANAGRRVGGLGCYRRAAPFLRGFSAPPGFLVDPRCGSRLNCDRWADLPWSFKKAGCAVRSGKIGKKRPLRATIGWPLSGWRVSTSVLQLNCKFPGRNSV